MLTFREQWRAELLVRAQAGVTLVVPRETPGRDSDKGGAEPLDWGQEPKVFVLIQRANISVIIVHPELPPSQ